MKRLSVLLVVALLSVGCTAPADPGTTLTVFAAASLKQTFTELGARFEAENPGTTVTFNFAGSADLAAQLTQGAPADVFASADLANMTKVADGGLLAGPPVEFATNTLTIVTAPGNPRAVNGFADLAAPDVQLVMCAPQVPCGAAAARIERSTGVELSPVSEESAVTDVLGKVTSGQADAGLVYITDAAAAGDKVATIAFPEAADAVTSYPIAVLADAADPTAARQFLDLVTGPDGRETLSAAGFAAP